MEFNEYQKLAKTTAKFEKNPYSIEGFNELSTGSKDTIENVFDFSNVSYLCLGLVGEAGEVAGKVKKVWRDSNGEFSEEVENNIKSELGDVLWYLSNLCSIFDFTLEDVANKNYEKLKDRMARNVISGSGDNR